MGITNPTAHAWVIRMNVRFATEILRHVGLVRIQTSGRKRVEQPFLRAVQLSVTRTRYDSFAKAKFGAVWEIDFLRRQYIFLHTVTF